jgi:hypothetical protein
LLVVVEVDDIGAGSSLWAQALKPIAATARVIMAMILMYCKFSSFLSWLLAVVVRSFD